TRIDQPARPALTAPGRIALIAPSFARIAQLVEQGIENPRVGGSIPPPGTILIQYMKASRKRGFFVQAPRQSEMISTYAAARNEHIAARHAYLKIALF